MCELLKENLNQNNSLKTLKDFECDRDDGYSCCSPRKKGSMPHSVDVDELQYAAREWIKDFQKQMHSRLSYMFHGTDDSVEYREARGAILAFIKFFNLDGD